MGGWGISNVWNFLSMFSVECKAGKAVSTALCQTGEIVVKSHDVEEKCVLTHQTSLCCLIAFNLSCHENVEYMSCVQGTVLHIGWMHQME